MTSLPAPHSQGGVVVGAGVVSKLVVPVYEVVLPVYGFVVGKAQLPWNDFKKRFSMTTTMTMTFIYTKQIQHSFQMRSTE